MKSDQELMEFWKSIKLSTWLIIYGAIQVVALGVLAYLHMFGIKITEGVFLFHFLTGLFVGIGGIAMKIEKGL